MINDGSAINLYGITYLSLRYFGKISEGAFVTKNAKMIKNSSKAVSGLFKFINQMPTPIIAMM